MRALALEQIRTEVPGTDATLEFARQLPALGSDAQAGLLSALADRGDPAAKSAVLDLLERSPAKEVQVAAWSALGQLGDASDCAALVGQLGAADEDVRSIARRSLTRLTGEGVTEALLAEFPRASLDEKVAIIDLITSRRDLTAKPRLFAWSVVGTPAIRQAAMVSLAELAVPEETPDMLPGVLRASRGAERDAAEKCVMQVAQREPDAEKRCLPILRALRHFGTDDQLRLLPTLGRVGGTAALDQIESALRSRDPVRHSAGIAAIANWPDASVAPNLIALVADDKHANHRILALRALLRVAPLPDGRSDQVKLELLKTAMAMCTRDAERKYALQRAAAIRLPETLQFVLPYVDQPAFAEQACATIVQLAHDRQLRDANKAAFHRALDRVIATSQDATLLERARRYKKGQTWVRPK
jgi:HEAT repeat protein